MKKQIQVSIIATIITIAIIISCAFILPATAESNDYGEFYPKLTVVVNTVRIESHLWVVECKDRNGNIWCFYDEEHTWETGDIANLLMWNISLYENEDEIVEVYWEGYTEDIEQFFSLEGWH